MIVPARLVDHPAWRLVLPILRLDLNPRVGDGAMSRQRVEIDIPDDWTRAALLAVRVLCARCRRPIAPIREREGAWSHYVAVSCDDPGCCRSLRASEEMDVIVAAALAAGVSATLPAGAPSMQGLLF